MASRRASEALIVAGHVRVNGAVVRTLGTRIDPAHDKVTVDGKPVRAKRKIYVALHKPSRCVCSRKDEHNRPTVYDLLPREWARTLHTVGRLDYDSEGLLFLTNDGDFSLKLTHPRYRVPKKYQVKLAGRIEEATLKKLMTGGVLSRGERLRALRARVLRASNSSSQVEIELAEGRNREVRRMFEALGHKVDRLQRTQIGRIKLGELRAARWRTLTQSEIKTLLADT